MRIGGKEYPLSNFFLDSFIKIDALAVATIASAEFDGRPLFRQENRSAGRNLT
jgi:hypothetical protein